MHYESTTGLCDEDIDELVGRIEEVLESRGQSLLGYRLGLRQQVELTLILARHNISQALAADMCGVSQPTVSRIWRRMVP
ncbi:transposase family protein, partial [Actinomyces slackii]